MRSGFEDRTRTELPAAHGRAHRLLPVGAPILQIFIFSSSFFPPRINEGVLNLSLDRTSILLGEAYIAEAYLLGNWSAYLKRFLFISHHVNMKSAENLPDELLVLSVRTYYSWFRNTTGSPPVGAAKIA